MKKQEMAILVETEVRKFLCNEHLEGKALLDLFLAIRPALDVLPKEQVLEIMAEVYDTRPGYKDPFDVGAVIVKRIHDFQNKTNRPIKSVALTPTSSEFSELPYWRVEVEAGDEVVPLC